MTCPRDGGNFNFTPDQIRQLRKELELTQQQLAERQSRRWKFGQMDK